MAVHLEEKSSVAEHADVRLAVTGHWWDPIATVYEPETNTSRILPMEGVRGFAVLLVFFVHFHVAFSSYVTPNSGLFHVSEFLGTVGNSGVDLFFIISGYLIYGAVMRPRFNYPRFFFRRVQRIYPTFLCVFFIFITLWVFSSNDNFKFHGTMAQQAAYVAENLFLLPGMFQLPSMITVTWSLSYEMFFYLVLPVVLGVTGLRRANRRIRLTFFLSLISLAVLVSPLVAHPRIRLIGFLFGIVLFEVARGFHNRRSRLINFLALGFYLCGLALIFAIDTTGRIPERLVAPLIAATAGATSFAFCGLGFHGSGMLSSIFGWAPLRWLGNMSYSYYLIHGLAIGVVRQVARRMFIPGGHEFLILSLFLWAFVASWVAATILFAVVEKPLSIQVAHRGVAPSSLIINSIEIRHTESSN